MNYFTTFALLATLATICSAFPTVGPNNYDQRCYKIPINSGEPIYETPVFRDCLVQQPCNDDELCCPKKNGGKCIKLADIEKILAPKKYDSRCFKLPLIGNDQDEVETQEFRDCLNKEPCSNDEICCPKKNSLGGKCIPKESFEKVKKPQYDLKCYTLPVKSGEPIFETPIFRDCLVKEPCSEDEICCPKQHSLGGKCIKKVSFDDVEQPKKYDSKCFKLPLIGNDQDEVETQEFRDCLNKEPCSNDEICCPKKNSLGGKCIPKKSFEKVKKPQYDLRCYTLPIKSGEPIFETPVFRDCLVKEPCSDDEICCPRKIGGKCIKKASLDDVEQPKKYDSRCFKIPLIGDEKDKIETPVYRDCLNKEPCNNNEICCPKKLGGGKCIPKSTLAGIKA